MVESQTATASRSTTDAAGMGAEGLAQLVNHRAGSVLVRPVAGS